MPTPARTTRLRRAGATSTVLALLTGCAVAAADPCVAATRPHRAAHGAAYRATHVADDWNDATWGDPGADDTSRNATGTYSARRDPGSLYTIENAIGARAVWTQTDARNRQLTGQGVTVALLDTGTAQVPGLTGAKKLSYGPDLSIESNGVLTDRDTFGHGTHMAGIIAAHQNDDGPLTSRQVRSADPNQQLGVAPDAELESLKLGTTDGSTDVSEVIAALNWITEHQTNADGSRVRVVNLSFGTDSVQPYQLDPLAAAAENAWKHGLVVVVSGGNDGPNAPLTDPAIDPYVLAVGASDARDSVAGWLAPRTASFSSGGTSRHVDLVAPGTSITSLRAPGSFVDRNHPEGLVAGDSSGTLFRGSGTSQAAAVVSGAVALLLQAFPDLTPDQVKGLLTASATPVFGGARYAGAGELNVGTAYALAKAYSGKGLFGGLLRGALPKYAQTFPASTGQGSIQAARGGDVLVDADGNPLTGEIDVLGNPWNPAAWWAAASAGTSWSGGRWLGAQWTGDGWSSTTSGTESARWDSARWDSARWDSARWDSARWDSARWDSTRWSSAHWSTIRWSVASWD